MEIQHARENNGTAVTVQHPPNTDREEAMHTEWELHEAWRNYNQTQHAAAHEFTNYCHEDCKCGVEKHSMQVRQRAGFTKLSQSREKFKCKQCVTAGVDEKSY